MRYETRWGRFLDWLRAERDYILYGEPAISPEVKVGVDLLDRVEPAWWDVVDVPRLAMWSRRRCVLGQLYPTYHQGVQWLGLPRGSVAGFCLPEDIRVNDRWDNSDRWAALRREWRAVILAKREMARLALPREGA